MELEALQQLINAQTGAQQQMPELERQRANAMALRGGGGQRAGTRSGYSSPLANIADVLNTYSSGKNMTALEPQIAQAQQAISAGEAAQTGYGLRKAAEKIAYDQQQDADALALDTEQEAYDRDQTAQQQALEATALEAEQAKMGKHQEAWNIETGAPKQTYVDPVSGRLIDADTLKPLNAQDYTFTDPADTRAKNTKRGSGKSPYAWGPKQRDNFQEDAHKANNVVNMIGTFDAGFANPTEGPLTGSASNFLAANVGGLATESMKERQAWWSDYKSNYELVTRHGLFGSALTKGETSEWKKASINENMTAEQIKTNLAKMQKIIKAKAAQAAGNARFAGLSDDYIYHNLGQNTPEDYIPEAMRKKQVALEIPEGIDPQEWAELDEDEKAYFKEQMQ